VTGETDFGLRLTLLGSFAASIREDRVVGDASYPLGRGVEEIGAEPSPAIRDLG
jgi:hypothetical protein